VFLNKLGACGQHLKQTPVKRKITKTKSESKRSAQQGENGDVLGKRGKNLGKGEGDFMPRENPFGGGGAMKKGKNERLAQPSNCGLGEGKRPNNSSIRGEPCKTAGPEGS